MNRSLAYSLLHRCTATGVAGIVTLAIWAMLLTGSAAASEIANRTKLFLDQQALPSGGEVEITVGDPDPRLNLATCQRYEPFIPNGARLWGRTYLGVRCVEGATWSAFMPVHIKVFAPSPVAARPIARGQTVGPDDVQIERVELTQWPAGVVATADQIEGRVATRAIAAGEPFRRDALKAQPVVQPGDPVKVVFDGGSFAVSTEGKALTLAADGQTVQVALTAGRVLSGIARPGKVVEIK